MENSSITERNDVMNARQFIKDQAMKINTKDDTIIEHPKYKPGMKVSGDLSKEIFEIVKVYKGDNGSVYLMLQSKKGLIEIPLSRFENSHMYIIKR